MRYGLDSYLAIPRANIKQWLRGLVMYAVGRHRRVGLDYRAALYNICRRADAIICRPKSRLARNMLTLFKVKN